MNGFLLVFIVTIFLSTERPRIVNQTEEDIFPRRKVQSMKGILAILVLLGHIAMKMIELKINVGKIFRLTFYLGGPAVAFFLFSSGYGLMSSLQSCGKEYLHGFIRRRIFPVAITYIAANILCAIAYIFFNIDISISEIVGEAFKGRLFVSYSWFAVAIIVFYFGFYIIADICECKKKDIVILLSLMMTLYVFVLSRVLQFPENWYSVSFSFILGVVLAGCKKNKINLLICVFMAGGGGNLLLLNVTYNSNLINILFKQMIGICFVLITLKFLDFIEFKENNLFEKIGKYSLEIYLVQGMFIRILFDYVDLISPILISLAVTTLTIVTAITLKKTITLENNRLK